MDDGNVTIELQLSGFEWRDAARVRRVLDRSPDEWNAFALYEAYVRAFPEEMIDQLLEWWEEFRSGQQPSELVPELLPWERERALELARGADDGEADAMVLLLIINACAARHNRRLRAVRRRN